MQIVIISDIHANLFALEAVLEILPAYDQLWCLGDTIGYGPRPNECLDYMRGLGTHVLTGNHDLACLGELPLDEFNDFARAANEWNNQQLLPDLRTYLHERPAKLAVEPDVMLAHASPRDPIWEYIENGAIAQANLGLFTQHLCLVGHTHVPMIFAQHADGEVTFGYTQHDESVQLRPGSRYILNPGSVGQPRDDNPRAAYAVWDTDTATVQFKRIGYDIGATQRQMRDAGLPEPLVERLAYGQ